MHQGTTGLQQVNLQLAGSDATDVAWRGVAFELGQQISLILSILVAPGPDADPVSTGRDCLTPPTKQRVHVTNS